MLQETPTGQFRMFIAERKKHAKRHRKTIGVDSVLLVLFLLVVLFIVSSIAGCSATPILGPSDVEIQAAEEHAASLPEGSEARRVAEQRAAALRAAREQADANAAMASGAINYLVPGLGGLVGLAYGIAQRIRNRKTKTMLDATLIAIEEIKKDPHSTVQKLLKTLAEKQDNAGVRKAIRIALAELKDEQEKP